MPFGSGRHRFPAFWRQNDAPWRQPDVEINTQPLARSIAYLQLMDGPPGTAVARGFRDRVKPARTFTYTSTYVVTGGTVSATVGARVAISPTIDTSGGNLTISAFVLKKAIAKAPFAADSSTNDALYYDQSTDKYGSDYTSAVPSTTVPTTWHRVTAVFDTTNNVATLYINGQVIATGTVTTPIGATIGVLLGNTFGDICSVQMSDLIIWTRALSAMEVAGHFADPHYTLLRPRFSELRTKGSAGGLSYFIDYLSGLELSGATRRDMLAAAELGAPVRADRLIPDEASSGVLADQAVPAELSSVIRSDRLSSIQWSGVIIPSDLAVPTESLASVRRDALAPAEMATTTRPDMAIPTETSGLIRSDTPEKVELSGISRGDAPLSAEASASLRGDVVTSIDALAGLRLDRLASIESLLSVSSDRLAPIEAMTTVRPDRLSPFEILSLTLTYSVDHAVPFELAGNFTAVSQIQHQLAAALRGDVAARAELGAGLRGDAVSPLLTAGNWIGDRLVPVEGRVSVRLDTGIAFETLIGFRSVSVDYAIPFELVGGLLIFSADQSVPFELLGLVRVARWTTMPLSQRWVVLDDGVRTISLRLSLRMVPLGEDV